MKGQEISWPFTTVYKGKNHINLIDLKDSEFYVDFKNIDLHIDIMHRQYA
jgi:hypothetical protein